MGLNLRSIKSIWIKIEQTLKYEVQNDVLTNNLLSIVGLDPLKIKFRFNYKFGPYCLEKIKI